MPSPQLMNCLEGLGGVSSEVSTAHPRPSVSLSLRLWIRTQSSQLLLQRSAFLLAAVFPAMMIMDWNCKQAPNLRLAFI